MVGKHTDERPPQSALLGSESIESRVDSLVNCAQVYMRCVSMPRPREAVDVPDAEHHTLLARAGIDNIRQQNRLGPRDSIRPRERPQESPRGRAST